jgi:hypothetical protein
MENNPEVIAKAAKKLLSQSSKIRSERAKFKKERKVVKPFEAF